MASICGRRGTFSASQNSLKAPLNWEFSDCEEEGEEENYHHHDTNISIEHLKIISRALVDPPVKRPNVCSISDEPLDDVPIAQIKICARCKDKFLEKNLDEHSKMGKYDSSPAYALDDRWYCRSCIDYAMEEDTDDGKLERMVAALGPQFRNRFGEICWAQGGPGFGWWPACIYDPRLTVSSARTLAKKNFGKKHLVYFFECHEAPFTVLSPEKLVDWEVGLVWEYDKGKTARTGGVKRAQAFDGALHQAYIEYNKPVDLRCDWNHNQDYVEPSNEKALTGASNVPVSIPANGSKTNGKKGENKTKNEDFDIKSNDEKESIVAISLENQKRIEKQNLLRRELKFLYQAKRQAKVWKVSNLEAVRRLKQLDKARNVIGNTRCRRENVLRAVKNNRDTANEHSQKLSLPLTCKVILKVKRGEEDIRSISLCIGYITLPDRFHSSFSKLRSMIKDKFKSHNDMPLEWRFHIPRLGPMSIKQEYDFKVLPFLDQVNSRMGVGSESDPIRILIQDRERYT